MSLLDALRAAGAIGPLDHHLARALARRGGEVDEAVLCAGALASRAPDRGDVGVDLAEVQDILEAELETPPALPDATEWVRRVAASPLVRRAGSIELTPLVLEGSAVYLDRFFRYQERAVHALHQRVTAPLPVLDTAALDDGLARLFGDDAASSRQRDAAEAAVRSRFTVVAGGPGTGKTAVVVKILALLCQQAHALGDPSPRTLLLAPTGKARHRLTESIRQTLRTWIPADLHAGIETEAFTIHTALETVYGTPNFKRDADNPLAADIVVVDEASMVALPLMAKLLAAVPPTARLILLGDPDQLRSVELGSVLEDIVQAPLLAPHVVHLEHTWRYPAHSGIQALARAINTDRPADALAILADPTYPDVEQIALTGDALSARLQALAMTGYRPIVTAKYPAAALEALKTFRVLCAHRHAGRLGVTRLSAEIERWLAEAGLLTVDQAFYAGRPILVTRNDDALHLANGDVGIILPNAEGLRRAWFEDETAPRALNPVVIPAHDTVFATTVHKAQGSEFDHVIAVLPPEPSKICTRELLYTAVTRAKQRVTIIGSDAVIRATVQQKVRRMSGFGRALAALSPDDPA